MSDQPLQSPWIYRSHRIPPFFGLPGLACFLYVASAACILAGVSQIIVPIYSRQELYAEKYACVGVLNLYELALLGVTLAVLAFRRAVDDAIALTILIAGFLGGSAIAIDTVAPGKPVVALLIGLGGLLLAMGKVATLHEVVVGRLSRWMLLGLGVALAASFLSPGVLAVATARRWIAPQMAPLWRAGWWCIVGGGMAVAVAAARLRERSFSLGASGSDEASSHRSNRPFIRSAAMRWIVTALVLAGCFLHGYVLTWVFALPVPDRTWLPVSGVAALVAAGLLRGTGARRWPRYAAAALLLPLLHLSTLGAGDQDVTGWWRLSPNYPPTFELLFALAATLLLIRPGRRGALELSGAVTAMAVIATLTFGTAGGLRIEQASGLNWGGALLVAGGVLALFSAARRSPAIGVLAVLAVATGLVVAEPFRVWLTDHHVAPLGPLAALVGVGVMLVDALFPRRLASASAAAAAMLAASGVYVTCFPESSGLYAPLTGSLALLFASAAVTLLTARWHTLASPGLLHLTAIYLRVPNKGWLLVAASFVILAGGALITLNRPREMLDD